MPIARCGCGELTASVDAYSPIVAACHCADCQRRTGWPSGIAGYYPVEAVTITGERREWSRPTASGGVVTNSFCPVCGSTIAVALSRRPELIGIPAGVFADPAFPPPLRSVWEEDKLASIDLAAPQYFERGAS